VSTSRSILRVIGTTLCASCLSLGTLVGASEARDTTSLPIGSDISSLAVASNGAAWVGVRGAQERGVGHASEDGIFHLTPVAEAGPDSLFGLSATIGSDGDAYFSGPHHEIFRAAPRGGVVVLGPFPGEQTFQPVAEGPDDTVWLAGGTEQILHVRPDATSYTTPFAAPIRGAVCDYANYQSMVQATDGAMWLSDVDCDRVVRISTAGTASVYRFGRFDSPFNLAPAPDGGVYFTDLAGVGHISRTGQVARHELRGGAGAIALAPDGTAWFSTDGNCGITEMTLEGPGRHVSASVIPQKIAFAPDGSVWLADPTHLVHATTAELETHASACHRRPPRIAVRPSITHPVTLTELERGFRISADEPAVISVSIDFSDPVRSSPAQIATPEVKVVYSRRAAVRVGIARRQLSRIRRDLAHGKKVTFSAFIEGANAYGNENHANGSGDADQVVLRQR
jgi:hypothetical protein